MYCDSSSHTCITEIVRVLDSLQLTVEHKVATPVDWKSGDKCMVLPTLSDTDAEKLFAKGFEKKEVPSGKGYIRMTPDPSGKKQECRLQ